MQDVDDIETGGGEAGAASARLLAQEAFEALEAGRPALVSTDTVYGLAALVGSAGHARIFELKERPTDQALPWLVGGVEDLVRYGRDVPAYALRLAGMLWPGALTLVVSASDEARSLGGVAGDGTIALRAPDDAALLDAMCCLEAPLACTSANLHGMPAASTAGQLDGRFASLPGADALAPACTAGAASTIVDCTGGFPRILREGPVPAQVVYDVALLVL